MKWKKLPSWLKGGLIAFMILIIIYVVLMSFFARWLCEYNDMGNIQCSNAQVLNIWLLPFSSISFIGSTIISILIVFTIGTLIGWTVRKVMK
ncbi:MAG: hypothetical protein AABX66_00920 [Nanoarchaeota archaeon]